MTQIEWTAEASPKPGARRLRERLRGVRVSGSLTVLFGALLFAALALAPFLPMVDLPQHAALIGAWVRLGDPTASEARTFTVNWQTPYLTAYVLCRVFAEWLSVLASVKLVVALACAGFQITFALLVRRLEYPAWLALLGVPLSVGFSFHFGFMSFLVGIPFALGALWAALGYAEDPSARRGLLLGGLLAATLLCHGFAAAIALTLATPVLLGGRGSPVRRVLPLFAPLLLGALWLLPGPSVTAIGPTVWEPRVLELGHLPALLLASSAADHVAWLFGAGVLALVVSALGRLHRNRWRWLPFAAMVLGFCLFPAMQSGFAPTYPRLVAFGVPTLLVAFEPRARAPRSRLVASWAPALAALLCAGWLASFGARLIAFQRETAPLVRVIEQLPAGLAMRPVVFERGSTSFPGLPALLHLPAYYAAEKGGRQGYSFAMYATSVLRYTPEIVPGMQGGAEWHPEDFSADAELPLYDCFVVHSRSGALRRSARRGRLEVPRRRLVGLRRRRARSRKRGARSLTVRYVDRAALSGRAIADGAAGVRAALRDAVHGRAEASAPFLGAISVSVPRAAAGRVFAVGAGARID
jgi:hypothetical protein